SHDHPDQDLSGSLFGHARFGGSDGVGLSNHHLEHRHHYRHLQHGGRTCGGGLHGRTASDHSHWRRHHFNGSGAEQGGRLGGADSAPPSPHQPHSAFPD